MKDFFFVPPPPPLFIKKNPNLYFLDSFTDKRFTAKNRNLVNFEDLNRILRSKIFLYTNSQRWAAHVVLGYTPISTSFQSLKHVIKAIDPWLARIDVVGSPPKRTQVVELTAQ